MKNVKKILTPFWTNFDPENFEKKLPPFKALENCRDTRVIGSWIIEIQPKNSKKTKKKTRINSEDNSVEKVI